MHDEQQRSWRQPQVMRKTPPPQKRRLYAHKRRFIIRRHASFVLQGLVFLSVGSHNIEIPIMQTIHLLWHEGTWCTALCACGCPPTESVFPSFGQELTPSCAIRSCKSRQGASKFNNSHCSKIHDQTASMLKWSFKASFSEDYRHCRMRDNEKTNV